MVWAEACWSWSRREAVSRTLPELAACVPYDVTVRTLQRHMSALVAAGLLVKVRGGGRGRGGAEYAPVDPDSQSNLSDYQADSRTDLSCHEGDSRSVTSGYEPDSQPKFSGSPFPSGFNPPSAGAHTHAREDGPSGRGEDKHQQGREVLDQLTRLMDDKWGVGTSSRIAPGYRIASARALGHLLAAGWTADQLLLRLNSREWNSAGSVGKALLYRIEEVSEEEPPRVTQERSRVERKARQDAEPCDHGTPGGCSACFMCRRGLADDDGVLCTCTPTADGLSPPGFTPALV